MHHLLIHYYLALHDAVIVSCLGRVLDWKPMEGFFIDREDEFLISRADRKVPIAIPAIHLKNKWWVQWVEFTC